MKKVLINNIGLKIASVAVAIILWLVVINIDDPVITRTYSGVSVEVTNGTAITTQGKTYKILDGSDTISVSVQAKRSVLEKMSRDYIKATANMKDLTFMDTVSIDVKSTRYADRIESITPLTKNLKVQVEDLQKKQMPITLETVGTPAKGYVIGKVNGSINIMSLSGPESIVSKISKAVASVDVTGMNSNVSATASIVLYDGNGDAVISDQINANVDEIHVDVEILETKEIPVVASVSGTPAEGFAATGTVTVEPESVLIAGNSSAYSEIGVVSIPDTDVSINDASDSILFTLNIKDYLPNGVILADSDYDGTVVVTVYIGKLETTMVDIPTANISVENLPDGYTAAPVDIGGFKRVEIRGLKESLDSLDPTSVTGTIDALTMTARGELKAGETYHDGSYDGTIRWNFPTGITEVQPSVIEVSMFMNTLVDGAAGENGHKTDSDEAAEGE